MIQLLIVDTQSGARRTLELPDRPLLIGSGVDCDVVLPSGEVSARQARIEPLAPAEGGFSIVDFHTEHETLLNGHPIGRARLRIGDVLRFGHFQVSVLPAQALPVATSSPAAAAAPAAGSPARAPEPRPAARAPAPVRAAPPPARVSDRLPRSSSAPAVIVGGAFVLLLVVVAIMMGGNDSEKGSDALRQRIAEALKQSDECRFDEALRSISQAIALAEGEEKKRALEHEAAIQDRKRRYDTGRQDLAALRTRVAADLTGSSLGDLDRFLSSYGDIVPLRDEAWRLHDDVSKRAETAAKAPPVNTEGLTLPPDRTVDWCVKESEKWIAQGEFGKAHFILTSVQPLTEAEKLRQREQLDKVNAAARPLGEEILQRVKEHIELRHFHIAIGEFDDDNLKPLKYTDIWYDLLEKADEVEDLIDQNIPEHARPVPRRKHSRPRPTADGGSGEKKTSGIPFPAPEVEGGANADRDGTADGAPATGSAAELQRRARDHLAAGEFALAAELLDLALVGASTPEQKGAIVRDHERAVRPLKLATRVAELLAARAPSGPLDLRLRGGGRATFVRSDGARLVVAAGGEERAVAPDELEARSLLEISGRVALSAEETVNRAFLALAVGDDKAFFACVDKAIAAARRDAAGGGAPDGELPDPVRGALDSALAFQRGLETVPPRGFVKVGERWLTWSEKAEEDLRREVREVIVASLEPGSGDDGLARVLEMAAAAPALVVEEMKARRDELAAELEAAPEQAKIARVREIAVELRAARTHALELIYDEEKYFYPYHPPACPPDKAALYAAVQQEVDARVAAVRSIWGREDSEPPAPHVTLSSRFLETLGRLRRVRQLLSDLGAASDEKDVALRPLWCLPLHGNVLHARNFAFDEYERARLDQDVKVLALNGGLQPKDGAATREELEQVSVTNLYRAMLGRRVLAFNEKLWKAARGHSDWMSRVGRLSHFEDDPERASPEQRMRLEGYTQGAGENCMVGRSDAVSAHVGWCHSSGHHRNLLWESHTEMGSGQSGAFWTQNFGGGREYKGNLIQD